MKIKALRAVQLLAALFVFCGAQTVFSQPAPPADPALGIYEFEDTNWLSVEGDPPIAFTNIFNVSLWNRSALFLDTTNQIPAYLNYNIIETNGDTNIEFDQGALRCLFICDWATADTNQNGSGPGAESYLLSAGDFSAGSPDGQWGVYFDPGGTNICFGGISNSMETVYVSAPISWPSNSIHLLGIVYTSSNSTLYLDGQLAATGSPVSIVPNTNTWTNGFFVGSDPYGYEQGRGIFSDLEFFNSNCLDSDWSNIFGARFFTGAWSFLTNDYYSWFNGGGFSPDYSGAGGGGVLIPGGGGGTCVTGTAVYMTNMSCGNVPGQGYTFTFTVAGGSVGSLYDIFTTTNFQGPHIYNAPWVWVGRGTNCGVYSIVGQTNNHALYVLGNPIPANDGTGLTEAYEQLIGTNTDGFGTPDAWYLDEGLSPQFAGVGTADADGDGLLNYQEYLYGSNPLVSEGFSVWMSEPLTTSGIP